jgi:hypothetical protein
MRATIFLVSIISIILFPTSGVRAQEWRGTVSEADGVEQVHSPGQPVRAEVTLSSRELWRAGGDAEDADLIGVVAQVVVDEEGNSYLLDQQLSQVLVYGPDGGLVRTIGREGAGPGEFRMAAGMCMLPGGYIGVFQMMPGRIVVFDREGNSLPDLATPGEGVMTIISGAKVSGQGLVIVLQESSLNESKITLRQSIRRMETDGSVGPALWETARDIDPAHMELGGEANAVPVWEVTPDGVVFLSTQYDRYSIDIYDASNELVRVVDREYESRKRTDEEIAKMKGRFKDLPGPMAGADMKVAKADRDILMMLSRGDGELWVLSSRSSREEVAGTLGAFESIDAAGHYDRNVRISADYTKDADTWFLCGDRLFVVKHGVGSIQSMLGAFRAPQPAGDSAEEPHAPEVVCYEVGAPLD